MLKKRLLSVNVFFAAMFLLLFFPGAQAFADRSYNISGYEINVAINKDGSADIEEKLTYSFSGQFNGILRDVDFSRTGGILNEHVYLLENGKSFEFSRNPGSSLEYQGKPGTYNYAKEGSLARFKVFEPSENERKTFAIKYKFDDVVVKYNDVAEFNRKLVDTGWKVPLNNISIKIKLPEGASRDEIRVFGHGPLAGESRIIDGQNVEFKIPAVAPGDFAETLVLFPPRLVPDSTNYVNKNALPGILENEGRLAEEANRQREAARQEIKRQESLISIANPLAVVLLLGWFALLIYIYLKYDRELKHNFTAKYYRELPGEYTPAEMGVLMSMGSVHSRDIMATLLDLIRKGRLALSTEKEYKKGLFGGKETTKYVITANDASPGIPNLKSHEEYLVNWFVGKIGNGISVSFDDIESYVRNRRNALQYKYDYGKWESMVKAEAQNNGFFDNSSKKGRTIGMLAGAGYFAASVALSSLLASGSIAYPFYIAPVTAFLCIQGILLFIFSSRIKRRSAYGAEQHAMWKAFRNFLREFSRMDKAQIPSIIIWEHYLVYAVSLGVAKDVIRQLPLVFNDRDLENRNLTFLYGSSFGYFAGVSQMLNHTSHIVESSVYTASSVANSRNSSASGFGGGFSGGSSGGGGGGGGGGAF